MKDSNNTSLTVRTKVASSLNNSISSLAPLVRTTTKFGNRNSTGTLTAAAAAAATASNPQNNNNSDDEFELPLGNLIIDLDADIEKSNERFSGENSESHHFATAGTQPSAASGSSATSSLSNSIANSISNQSPAGSNPFEATNSKAMSTSKTIRDVNNGTTNSNSTQQINQSTSASQANSLSNSSSSSGGKTTSSSSSSSTGGTANLQSLTVEKSLKLKLKRKSIGGKSSESKPFEVVQSDTNPRHNSASNSSSNYSKSSSAASSSDKNGLNNLANNSAATNSTTNEVEKIKHSSSKSKNSSHKEKKEKKDKADKNSSGNNSSSAKNSNDAFGNSTPQFNNGDSSKERNPVVLNFDKKALNQSSTTGGEPHHHHSFNQLKKDANDSVDSPPLKKSKNDNNNKNTQPSSSSSLNHHCTNTNKPEMRSVSTATNASTMTEPECLGFCEPGSAICLEGITWVEAEGVLVVNVTWRGKSYVGTLLDCTRHDWGPPHPRLCDSPTSDLESKGLKSGRGKRARSSISEQDSRLFQSKLRNGKGRRNNFTVPASPLKVDQNNKRNNRNGKDAGDNKSNNSSQPNSRNTPTPTPLDSSDSLASSPLPKQPSSPVFIECPEPTCGKKYRHINGLKYHQNHSHSATKPDDLDDACKEPTDADAMEVESFASSPQCVKTTSDTNCNETNSVEPNSVNSSESVDSKKSKQNCDKTKNSDNDTAHSPVYSDISDAGENGNEPTERNASNASTVQGDNRKATKPDKASGDLNNGDQRKESESLTKDEEPSKPSVKEEHKATSDKEDKPSIAANNGVPDKNGLSVTNNINPTGSGQPQPLPPPPGLMNPAAAMNPNFQFPFNVMPHNLPLPHIPMQFPMEEDPLDAYRMRSYGESYKKHMASFGKTFPPPKSDQLHLNELKQHQHQHQHQQSQFKTPPLSTSTSPQSQQPPISTHSSMFNPLPQSAPNQQSPQNKPSSPYDFAHHEKQQREEMLKLSGRGSEERFSLSSNKNQLGNLSSPKQQPSSVQQLFGQANNPAGSGGGSSNSNHKDEQRTPKHAKQEEGIKPTMETTGPPPQPLNHSFFHSISPFLGPQVFPGALPFDPNSPLFRAQQAAAAAANPFNQQSFMNNLRYPNPLAPQLPPGLEMRANLQPPPNMPGQELNNKLMNANGNKKAAFEMLQQVSQQYNLKDMQDKMLSSQSPNSAVKNGLPPVSMSNHNPMRHSPSNQLGGLANAMRKEDNLSPQRLHHPGIPPHPVLGDPYGALINNASGFPKR